MVSPAPFSEPLLNSCVLRKRSFIICKLKGKLMKSHLWQFTKTLLQTNSIPFTRRNIYSICSWKELWCGLSDVWFSSKIRWFEYNLVDNAQSFEIFRLSISTSRWVDSCKGVYNFLRSFLLTTYTEFLMRNLATFLYTQRPTTALSLSLRHNSHTMGAIYQKRGLILITHIRVRAAGSSLMAAFFFSSFWYHKCRNV